MWSIRNSSGERLMAVDHFCHPNQPVFTDDVDEAMIFENENQAAGFLAGLFRNRNFDDCQIHNERPSSLYW